MLNKNFKKFKSIIILFLLYISLKNITKFTDDSLEMPIENYGFQENEELVNFDLNTKTVKLINH